MCDDVCDDVCDGVCDNVCAYDICDGMCEGVSDGEGWVTVWEYLFYNEFITIKNEFITN